MLVVLYTRSYLVIPIKCASFRWHASCIFGEVCFLFHATGPSFLERPFFSMVLIFEYRFFSRVLVWCDCASVFLFRATVLPVSCCTCSPRYRVRDNQYRYQIKSTMALLFFASRSVPLGSELSSWIPTASAVRYYTEIQSCLTAAVFPSILSGNSALLLLSLCNGGSIRIDTQHSLDLRDLVNRLYGSNSCSDRISLSMSTRCSLVDLLVWSSGAIDRRLQHSCVIFFFCCCCSLSSIVRLSRLFQSIDRIN